MNESLNSQRPETGKNQLKRPRFLSGLAIFLTLASCNPPSVSEAEGKVYDAQSKALTIGDNQRDINEEGLGYVKHYGKGDDKEISILDKRTARRAKKNERNYDEALEEIGRAESRRDKAKRQQHNKSTQQPNGTNETEEVKKSGYNYNPRQFSNSDDAIKREMERRESKIHQ